MAICKNIHMYTSKNIYIERESEPQSTHVNRKLVEGSASPGC